MPSTNQNELYRNEPTPKVVTRVGKAALEKIKDPGKYPGSPDPCQDAQGFAAWFKKNILGIK